MSVWTGAGPQDALWNRRIGHCGYAVTERIIV
jgi:hypothetical protein